MNVSDLAIPLALGAGALCTMAGGGFAKKADNSAPAAPGSQEPATDATTVCDIGVFGMGVMGQNLR